MSMASSVGSRKVLEVVAAERRLLFSHNANFVAGDVSQW